MRVYWSDRLEELVEGMFAAWESQPFGDPFAKTCVVVGDLAMRDWLRDYFLLKRKDGKRRVLANVDFKLLPEFVNDWLAAVTRGVNAGERRASEHPYSQGVLTWRINAILKDHADDSELAILKQYVSGKTAKVADRRRYDLSVRLAQLYDDYLVSRHEMLARWERGEVAAGEDRWQAVLYRLLAAEVPETYAGDFACALADDCNIGTAFENGFPEYAAVHVFDVMTCPWPYLQMLKRMSEKMPLSFWNFNPSKKAWTGVSSFDTPDAKLLGSLATGAHGMLAAEKELVGEGCVWTGKDDASTFESLKRISVEEHVCFSPRRELEAARDALHRFFAETSDAHPSDALVLCADWARYAPLIESVFCSSGSDSIPVALARGVADNTPITHSLGQIFDFRTNRFEVSKVFALLSVPHVRMKFGLNADQLSTLRCMLQKNNIRWGYDDADVEACLGSGTKGGTYPFTWRRGLDRFIADALLGPRPDERDVVDLGNLGRLQPCGRVEDERARIVASLNAFVMALNEVRQFIKGSHSAEEWRDRLLRIVDDFYSVDDGSIGEVFALRRAIMTVVANVLRARECSQAVGKDDPIPGEVMCRSILSSVAGMTRKVEAFGDSVRFAPLSNGSAVSAKFVWICGLNDGTFPRVEYRPAFDLVGQSPTSFDVTIRERDGFALLKASLGARERLSFSFVGRSIKTNESVPASVSLLAMLDWFKATQIEVKKYEHPLQPYSPRYFTAGENLPPSYSASNRTVAAALVERKEKDDDAAVKIRPFEIAEKGETVIDLDELVGFYSRPNHFLATKRLGFRVSSSKYDQLNDEDKFGADVPSGFVSDVMLYANVSHDDIAREGERDVEEGSAENANLAVSVLQNAVNDESIKEFHDRRIVFAQSDPERAKYSCPAEDVAKRFVDAKGGKPAEVNVEIGDGVRIVGVTSAPVDLVNADGDSLPTVLVYGGKGFWPSEIDAAWIRHLALNASGRHCVTVLFSIGWKNPHTFRPVPLDEACGRLRALVDKATCEFSVDMDKARGKDELPDEYKELVDSFDYCFYKAKRWNRR